MGRLGCESIARLEFPQNSQTLSNYDPHSPQMPGFLEFWGNSTLPAFSHFQASGILGKFEPGSVLVTSDANSNFPKFARISPKSPKPQQLWPELLMDARILGFWEIRAWRCFGNLGCENTARLEFPKIHSCTMYSYMSFQLLQFPTVLLLLSSKKVIAVVKITFAQYKTKKNSCTL